MKIVRNLAILLVFVTFSARVSAQRNFSAEADQSFNLKQYSIAIDMYAKAYTKVKGNKAEKARIIYQTALCYKYMNDPKKAETWFKKAVKIKYEDALVYLYYAEVLKMNGKYDEALIQFQDYKQLAPSDPRGDNGIEACKLASSWIQNPTRYEIENMKQFNSKQADFSPCYADKKFKSLFFTSNREDADGSDIDAWTGGNFTDLFFVTLDRKGKWSTPVAVGEPINTKFHEGASCLNDKASTMYYTRCEFEKKKELGCRIWVSSKKGPAWDLPEVVTLSSDTNLALVYLHPTLTADELTLYFSSDMPGGQGGKDIWKVTRSKKTKPWENPTNLGPTINTAGDEMYPYIHDNGTLYFASNGHMGMGGLDMFKAEPQAQGFGTPQNMKFPMNSSFDDFGIIFEGISVEKGYFSSNRPAGRGDDDIYAFVLPPLIFTLKGIVTNDSTKAVMPNAIVEMKGSDGTVVYDTTDVTGMYKFEKHQVLQKTTYSLSVKKNKFLTTEKSSAEVTTVGLELSKDLVQDLALIPTPKIPIVLPDILYDLAKWDLKPQYQDSLNGLYNTLIKNDNLVIELSSHTDIRGSSEYNDSLSFKRAKSVVDYLITKGIAADRMIPKGYGERQPRTLDKDKIVIYNNKPYSFTKGTQLTEAFINALKTDDEKEAAHQLNRRTEFKILREDYVPTENSKKVEPMKIEIMNNEGGATEGTDAVKKEEPKTTEPKKEEPKKTEGK
ncbi:MAG: OmpA family protein [Bacteroidota bacterium]